MQPRWSQAIVGQKVIGLVQSNSLLAKRGDEAFDLAERHDEMAIYADAVKDKGSGSEYVKIAKYYETKAEW